MTAIPTSDPADRVAARAPTRPFLKWVGGKTRLLSRLMPYVPQTFADYHEPFLGGGAMFFAVQDRMGGVPHLHDLNDELVNAWQCMQQDPSGLLQAMEHYLANDSKTFYYEQRTAAPETLVDRAARFIYLNQTSWNGLWRVNRWGGFNVPWGDRPFRGLPEDTVHRLSDLLIGASITGDDFRVTLEKPQKGDFVYLDPPYLPISDTSKFYLYTQRRFRLPDLGELADLCHDLTDRGVMWMMSNRDTKNVRDLFPEDTIIRFTARRGVAAQNRRDVEASDSPEALILSNNLLA